MISENVLASYRKLGVTVLLGASPTAITKTGEGVYTVHYTDAVTKEAGAVEEVDCVLFATGRKPLTSPLNLAAAGVAVVDEKIVVDDYCNTSTPGVYAVGDAVTISGQDPKTYPHAKKDLTPVAIQAGRSLADRLFAGHTEGKMDYLNVPTVVFSHPPVGTVGLTQKQAVEAYGGIDNLDVYTTSFANMFYQTFQVPAAEKPKTYMKLICEKATEKVLGLHIVGIAADEILQGFGVAVKMGATKADFDRCMAIHPTAAEELVTFAPWGMSWKRAKAAAGAGSASL